MKFCLVNEAFDDWEFVPDFTGTVYQKLDGQPVEWEEYGSLPEQLTHLKPKTQWDEWGEGQLKWVKNCDKEQAALSNSVLPSFASQSYRVKASGHPI